jgi:citrate lyase subunit alpha/citrate CoA-transferase
MEESDVIDNPYINNLAALHGIYKPDSHFRETKSLAQREKDLNKVVPSLEEAVRLSGLKNGMTISFHHHFRNGDCIVNKVVEKLAQMGFENLTIAASSLTDIHDALIPYIKNGVIGHIETSGMRGKLAEAISCGIMEKPVVFRSHGGRAYAIETGEMQIDVAFLGVPSCDPYGNANGYSRDNDTSIIFGSMGYAKVDAQYAKKTVLITNNLVPYPNIPFGIPESDVDYIVMVDEIGNPNEIMSGATRFTSNPKDLLIAQQAADVIEASGYFQEGFSMQMGSGGASLAVARFLRKKMIDKNIRSSFALGGITASIVDMHEEGLIKKILDVQSFDLTAAQSLKNNRFHQQISASYYASPSNLGTAVNQLDIVVLSALEIDINYNVNVLTGSDGMIRGAIGGHPDTAAGASMTIIVAPLIRGRIPTVVERVNTVVTPGNTVDVLVTDQGIAVNARRMDIKENLKQKGIRVCSIEELRDRAEKIVGIPKANAYEENVVGVVAYRDNTIIDLIQQIKQS